MRLIHHRHPFHQVHLQSQPYTSPSHIIVQPSTRTLASPSQSLVTSSTLSSVGSPTMAQRPWNSPVIVTVPAPLNPLPAHPKKWLPKSNPDIGILTDEHINNFMLSVNLKGVTEEDVVVRISHIPYKEQLGLGTSHYHQDP